MPIRSFLKEEAFDPETIQKMGSALTAACQALGLTDKEDAVTQLLAIRIIDLARDGVDDLELLTTAALKGFQRAATGSVSHVDQPHR